MRSTKRSGSRANGSAPPLLHTGGGGGVASLHCKRCSLQCEVSTSSCGLRKGTTSACTVATTTRRWRPAHNSCTSRRSPTHARAAALRSRTEVNSSMASTSPASLPPATATTCAMSARHCSPAESAACGLLLALGGSPSSCSACDAVGSVSVASPATMEATLSCVLHCVWPGSWELPAVAAMSARVLPEPESPSTTATPLATGRILPPEVQATVPSRASPRNGTQSFD